jgi:copper transport protein
MLRYHMSRRIGITFHVSNGASARKMTGKRYKRVQRERVGTEIYPVRPVARVARVTKSASNVLLALVLGITLALLSYLPLGILQLTTGIAQARILHALPVETEPANNAVLQTPPTQVIIWFDERIIPATSHIIVDNAQQQQVNMQDSVVSASNPREMSVALPSALPGGTYTVLWVAQSADDGHVTQGSFTFRVVGGGTPLSLLPGGRGSANKSGYTLDGPTIVQAITTWLALLGMTLWVGGLIWETWILVPNAGSDADLAAAGRGAERRFQRLAQMALYLVWVANIGLVCSLVAQYAGGWSQLGQLSAWQAVLFGSSFGTFWWMRQLVVMLALVLLFLAEDKGWSRQRRARNPRLPAESLMAIPDWWHAVLVVFRNIPHLPRQLVNGWRQRSWSGRAELLLGFALLLAFALSGHASAVPNAELPYSLSVDMLHLICNAAWVGGLLYIGFALIPALSRLNERQHARVLALGLPRFSALAMICALLLAMTGSLNTSIHFTSIMQFVTTLYGEVLATKILFFLAMVAISAYHAFSLRPRLARLLLRRENAPQRVPVETSARLASQKASAHDFHEEIVESEDNGRISPQARSLAIRMEIWLHREALLGLAILMCVGLLSIFAGTL